MLLYIFHCQAVEDVYLLVAGEFFFFFLLQSDQLLHCLLKTNQICTFIIYRYIMIKYVKLHVNSNKNALGKVIQYAWKIFTKMLSIHSINESYSLYTQ